VTHPQLNKLTKKVDIQRQKAHALNQIIWTLRGISMTGAGGTVFAGVAGTTGIFRTDGPVAAIAIPGVILALVAAYGISAVLAYDERSRVHDKLAEVEEDVEHGYQAEILKPEAEHHVLLPLESLTASQRANWEYQRERRLNR
jgi:hypothetical protein